MQHQTLPRTRLTAIAFSAIVLASVGAPAVGADAADPPGACTDGEGVTVVVDFTELGGEVEVGCAPEAATGTAALASAGFAEERAENGTICAINSLPDPCPAEFTGSYWSYWYAEGGEWRSWMEGSDTAVPVAGGAEGWRYNDGSAGPGVDPAALAVLDDGGQAESDSTPATTMPEVSQTDFWVLVLVGGAILAAALVVGVRLVTRRSGHGPDGQD